MGSINDRTLAGEYDSALAESLAVYLEEFYPDKTFSFKEFGGWIDVRKGKTLIAHIDPDESTVYPVSPDYFEHPHELGRFLCNSLGKTWKVHFK